MLDVVVDDSTFPLPPSALPLRAEPLWLPAGMLATVLMLTLTATALGGDSQLKWRSAGAKSPRGMATQAVYHSERGKVSGSRFVDRSVRTVAYNDPPVATERSVLAEPPHPVHVAQGQNDFNFGDILQQQDDLEREFQQPLDDSPIELPNTGGAPETNDLKVPPIDLPEIPKDNSPAADPSRIESPAVDTTDDRAITFPKEDKIDPFDEFESDSSVAPRRFGRDQDDSTTQELREEARQDCAEELATLRASSLKLVDIHIGRSGVEGEDYPFVCSIDDGIPFSGRSWAPVTFTWKASALCHKPLYFEQEQLERYGHSWGPMLQPVVSGAHFFSRLPILPYAMGLKTPNECVYALGHYRPGSCAPYMIPAVPFTWRAAIFQGGAATGAALIIP